MSSKSEANSLNPCNKSKDVDENKDIQIYGYLYHRDNQFPGLIYGFPKNTCLPPQSHEITYTVHSPQKIINQGIIFIPSQKRSISWLKDIFLLLLIKK